MNNSNQQIATLAGGCFWCTEAVFQNLKGVLSVKSGYTGGAIKNPAYREICTGRTGHAEAVQIEFDEKVISYVDLLEVFFKTHDPTTLNRQGNDSGTQYRSAIFYHTEEQKNMAEEMIQQLDKSGIFPNKIVTEVIKATAFYPAEPEHHNYYNRNKDQPYCQLVITPKIEKLKAVFENKTL